MSAHDLPRIYFRGTARIHAPTGDRNAAPVYDLSTQRVYRDGAAVPSDEHPHAMHRYLKSLGPRFDLEGRPHPDGPVSAAAGWNFGGNGHFSWNARISAVQLERGRVITDDPLVGRAIDLWGHYNPYLGTTFNRARFVRHDPASPWSAQVLSGRLTIGRGDRSLDVPYELSADVAGPAPARLQRYDFIRDLPEHWLRREHAEAATYQTVLPREGIELGELGGVIRAVDAALHEPCIAGLVLRFTIFNLWAGAAPEGPGFADVVGVIAPWRPEEMRSFPAGRLLVPQADRTLGATTVHLGDGFATLDIASTVPRRGREARPRAPFSAPVLGPAIDLGPLELRTASGTRLAVLPYAMYAGALEHGAIVDVPIEPRTAARARDEGLVLVAPERSPEALLVERELVVQADDVGVTLEHASPGAPTDAIVEVRSFFRGDPIAVRDLHAEVFYDPRAVPGWRWESPNPDRYVYPLNHEVEIVAMRGRDDAAFATSCTVDTDEEGRGRLQVSARRSGAARVLLVPHVAEVPSALRRDDSEAASAYVDIEDRLGIWGTAGSFGVRVLPDARHLEAIADEDVDYELLYREVLQPYELLYSFMSDEVFSLADRCKVETYARLMWQMSDPANADKTYFMPPTRDLSRPKIRLLRAYLRNVERRGPLPSPIAARQHARPIEDRAQLVAALRAAVELEQLIMLAYLFAAYSVPNYETAKRWVEHGVWTDAQLRLACGDGAEGLAQGFRGTLLEIAHEEMIHFLVVNNVLRAVGEPFYTPVPDFEAVSRLGHGFPIELSPLSTRTLENLLHLELPHGESPPSSRGYGSIAELYRSIREALVAMPELIVIEPRQSGGEHHLFLNEAYDRHHPDYQLEVDDLPSACFALDFVTGQGEGAPVGSKLHAPSHHQRLRRMAAIIASENARRADDGLSAWPLSYPMLSMPSRFERAGRAFVPDRNARKIMDLLDATYSVSIRLMSLHFAYCPRASLRRSKLMNASIDVMTGMMRPLAITLVGMESGVPGWNAGPGFESGPFTTPTADARLELAAASAECERLSAMAKRIDVVPRSVRELLDFFVVFLADLSKEIGT